MSCRSGHLVFVNLVVSANVRGLGMVCGQWMAENDVLILGNGKWKLGGIRK